MPYHCSKTLQNLEMNWDALIVTNLNSNPCTLKQSLINSMANCGGIGILCNRMKCAYLVFKKKSTTRKGMCFCDGDKSVVKSIFQGWLGFERVIKRPDGFWGGFFI